jgi:hypothetical protein
VTVGLEEHLSVGVTRAAAEVPGALGELAAILQPSGKCRQGRAPHRHVPGEGRQPRLRGERGVRVELGLDEGAVAELEQVDHAPVAGLERKLAVTRSACQPEHLGRALQTGCRVLRCREDDVTGIESRRKRRRIPGTFGQL